MENEKQTVIEYLGSSKSVSIFDEMKPHLNEAVLAMIEAGRNSHLSQEMIDNVETTDLHAAYITSQAYENLTREGQMQYFAKMINTAQEKGLIESFAPMPIEIETIIGQRKIFLFFACSRIPQSKLLKHKYQHRWWSKSEFLFKEEGKMY